MAPADRHRSHGADSLCHGAPHCRREALPAALFLGSGRRTRFALAAMAAAAAAPVIADSGGIQEARAASATASLAGWAARGRLDKVALLLEQRADVRFDNDYGSTALHATSIKGHSAVAEVLASQRANVDAVDLRGLRPLHWASLHGHRDVVMALLAARAAPGAPADLQQQEPLHLAARTGSADVVEGLLAAGAPADEQDDEGCTPLIWAAFGGHAACGALLLEYKADTGKRDVNGETALHWAARGHLEMVKALLDHGASPSRRAEDGKLPAWWAEHEGRGDILALLGVEGMEKAPPGVIADGRRRTSTPWFIDVEL